MAIDTQDSDRPSRTDRVLEFIRDFRAQRQVSPTIREIGRGVGISSTSVVNYHVGKLVADGQLLRAVGQGVPRNLLPANGKVSSDTDQVSSVKCQVSSVTDQAQDAEEDGFVD